MADASVSAVDKVGIPGPDVFRPSVKASSQDGQPFLAVCPPAPDDAIEREKGKFAEKPVDKPESLPDNKKPSGIISRGHSGHSLGAPKPVEVASVPQTPLNDSTPAGGTPRPELKTAQDPAPTADEPSSPEPAVEPVVMTGVQESAPAAPETSAPKENNDRPKPLPLTESHQPPTPSASESSLSKEPTISKATELAAKAPIVNGTMNVGRSKTKPEVPVTHAATGPASVPAPAPTSDGASVAPPAPISETSTSKESESYDADDSTKPPGSPGSPGTIDPVASEKRKLDEVAVPATPKPLAEDDASAGPGALPLYKKPKIDETASKASKPKKEKKLPAVGRAARKTRSQGPVDV